MRRALLRTLFACTLLLPCATRAHADPGLAWVARYDSVQANDYVAGVAFGPDGNLVVAGTADWNYLIRVYSPAGAPLREFRRVGFSDVMRDMVVADGYVYVTGQTYANWPTNNVALTMRWDPVNGGGTWIQTVPGTSSSYAVAVDGSGGVWITGTKNIDSLMVARYLPSGPLQWVRGWQPGSGGCRGVDIAVDQAGNAFVVGTVPNANAQDDIVVMKFDSTGGLLWTRTWNGAANAIDQPIGVRVNAQGDAIVSGTTAVSTPAGDYVTMQYDGEGNREWIELYDGSAHYLDAVSGMALDAAGNVYVTGGAAAAAAEVTTLKYDASGVLQWVARWGGANAADDRGNAITIDPAGNVFVTGPVDGESDIGTHMIDPAGHVKWGTVYGSPFGYWDRPAGIVVDSLGAVVVAGSSNGASTWADWLLLGYTDAYAGVAREPIAGGLALACGRPNPFRGSVALAYTLPRESAVRLGVYDVGGRLVRELARGTASAGEHVARWDGRERDGRVAPSGLYFVELRTPQQRLARRIVKME